MDVVGVAGGLLLVLMFEAPIPFILIGDLLYIYNAIQHLLQWLQVIKGCSSSLLFALCLWDLRVESGCSGGLLLVLMIEASHSLHTHIRSSLYIYNSIQHLVQWLVVIRMQLQPYMCSWER